MAKYKLLLFDIDNTLVNYEKTEQEALKYIYDQYYINNCNFDVMVREFNRINANYWFQYRAGTISLKQLRLKRFAELNKMFNARNDSTEITSTYENILGNKVYICSDTTPFLSWAKKNYELAIVSNGITEIQQKKLTITGIKKYFTGIFLSEDVGSQKPNKKIFELALTKLRYSYSESLMIGDSVDSDLLGAANAKIDFCWLNRRRETLPMKYPVPRFEVSSFGEIKTILNSVQNNC